MKPGWPLWRIILAYALMTVIAFVAVWFMDRKVQLLPTTLPSSSAIAPTSR